MSELDTDTSYPAGREVGQIPTPTADDATPTREVAAQQARAVAEDAKAGGKQVADTAMQEAGDVAREVKLQTRELYSQAKEELGQQAAVQTDRARSGLLALADELDDMVRGATGTSGLATDAAQQASERVRSFAGWLEGREPGDIMDEARRFAARRPGSFLLGAALLGLVGGRLTRGLADDAGEDEPTAPSGRVAATSGGSVSPTATPLAGRTVGESGWRDVSADQPEVDSPLTGSSPLTGNSPEDRLE